ncbi:hypothetical protein BDZ97DRAFT_1921287 [Flammula alnicola]|nr:hypothetical protein BDZ97DRAFT_1921287 [Flammula alnicola]
MSNIFFYEPFYDFERLVEESLAPRNTTRNTVQRQRNSVDGAVRSFKPRMDLHEDSEKNLVTAAFEFPGISKENFHLDIHNGKLTVSAETKAVERTRCANAALASSREPSRSLKDDEIKASLEVVLLSVTFPKTTPELHPSA